MKLHPDKILFGFYQVHMVPTIFCFHVFTSPAYTSLIHHKGVPFLSYFNLFLFSPYISF